MSYHAGIGPRLAAALGGETRPHAKCDACGLVAYGATATGRPTKWWLASGAPRGWLTTRHEVDGELRRSDTCNKCRALAERVPPR